MKVSSEGFIKKTIGSNDFQKTFMHYGWRLLSGPLLLILIPFFLSPEEQGFWFTFLSLGALVVFADLGFSTIILQFSAHEYSHLSFSEKNKLTGSEHHLKRISGLFQFSLIWACFIALIIFPVILIIGYVLFLDKSPNIEWFLPWLIFGIASVLVFINSIILSFIEGCDRVGDINYIRFLTSLINVLLISLLLFNGFSLYSLAIALSFSAILGATLIIKRYRHLIIQLWNIKIDYKDWLGEILPLLGRYSVSWISGYFIFQLFTPVAFHFYGSIEAGQVGLTVAIFTALFSISNIWITIITPKINMHIAKQDYLNINRMFSKSAHLSAVSFVLLILFFFFSLTMIDYVFPFTERLVSFNVLFFLAIAWFFQIYINAMAVYMRAHKQEPLMWLSLLNALYVSMFTILIAYSLAFDYFFMGFISSFIWLFPFVLLIFKPYFDGYRKI